MAWPRNECNREVAEKLNLSIKPTSGLECLFMFGSASCQSFYRHSASLNILGGGAS